MSPFVNALAANILSMGIVAVYFVISVNMQLRKNRKEVSREIEQAQQQVKELYTTLQITGKMPIRDDVPTPRGNS